MNEIMQYLIHYLGKEDFSNYPYIHRKTGRIINDYDQIPTGYFTVMFEPDRGPHTLDWTNL